MKKLFAIICIIAALTTGCAGMQTAPTDQLTFSQVYEMPGHSSAQIYDGVRIWISENFRSGKAVVDLADKENGIIIGNGASHYPCNGTDCIDLEGGTVGYTMRVDVKDEKFRLTFSNLETVLTTGNHPMWMQGQIDNVKPILLSHGEKIKASIATDNKKSEW